MMDDLNTLAGRVQAASAKQQATMLELAWDALAEHSEAFRAFACAHCSGFGTNAGKFGMAMDARAYVSAALMLVPKDHEWSVNWFGNSCAEVSGIPEGPPHYGCAATAPLALAAAALRAHAGAKP